jgi:O-antigen/teichoic acid export membrane protein
VSGASREELRELVRPALSFMAFPVGNAISIQGMTLIVGHLFGAPFLAVFSTYRTITRALVQGVTVIGRSLWPEISRRFGAGDLRNVISIYKKGTLASVCLAVLLCTFMFFCGEPLLRLWTGGRIPYESGLFRLFLLATALTSIWQMGMIVLSATNSHSTLSIAYVFGANLSLLLSWSLAETIGRYAPMVGMISFEIFLIVVCAMLVLDFRRDVLEVA